MSTNGALKRATGDVDERIEAPPPLIDRLEEEGELLRIAGVTGKDNGLVAKVIMHRLDCRRIDVEHSDTHTVCGEVTRDGSSYSSGAAGHRDRAGEARALVEPGAHGRPGRLDGFVHCCLVLTLVVVGDRDGRNVILLLPVGRVSDNVTLRPGSTRDRSAGLMVSFLDP